MFLKITFKKSGRIFRYHLIKFLGDLFFYVSIPYKKFHFFKGIRNSLFKRKREENCNMIDFKDIFVHHKLIPFTRTPHDFVDGCKF